MVGFWEMVEQRLGSIFQVTCFNFRFWFCGHPRPVSNQKIWILWVFLVFWLPCCLIKDWNDQKWKSYIGSKPRGGLVLSFTYFMYLLNFHTLRGSISLIVLYYLATNESADASKPILLMIWNLKIFFLQLFVAILMFRSSFPAYFCWWLKE